MSGTYTPPNMPYDLRAPEGQFEKKSFTATVGSGTIADIRYRVHIPDRIEGRVPLVLFLHGAGERGEDNEAQLKAALPTAFSVAGSEMHGAVVIAPQCPSDLRWVDVPWSEGKYCVLATPETYLLELVAKLVARYAAEDWVDETRVYVMGISMGGFGTWDMLTRHPDLFAAGLPICGGADETYAKQLAQVPIYTFHGTEDDAISYQGTAGVVAAIRAQGKGRIHYVQFEGAGHNIWDRALAYAGDGENPPPMQWLFAQRKQGGSL